MAYATQVPHALPCLKTADVEIFRVLLDRGPDALDQAELLLADDEVARADRFVFARDRARYVAARASLRQLLGERLGIPAAAVAFEYGPHGKPTLAGHLRGADLRFNLSHCNEVAVCAFTHGLEVGVDVEAVRTMSDADAIAARNFSQREQRDYGRLAPTDKPLGFFNCWTRKEAFVKALGEGLGYPLDRFDVSLAPDEPAEIRRVGELGGRECGWKLASFVPVAGYVAAVVLEAAQGEQ